MRIAFDIDDTITRCPEFFAIISKALIASGHRVYVLTYREDREFAEQDLAERGVVFDELVLPTEQAITETTGAPVGNLTKQRAIWVDRDTILWKISGGSGLKYALVYSPDAALELSPDGIANGQGECPVRLHQGRYFVVVDALLQGRYAMFNTDTSELVPVQLF